MLAGLGGEDDRADAPYLHGGGVPKLDGASHAGIQVGEVVPSPGHVMGGTGVEEPTVNLVIIGPIAEEDVCVRFVDVEKSGSWSSAGILEEIALKCGSKVEYRSALRNNAELQFSIEVWIVGEKVGEGIGRTRKEAQGQAAEVSLRNLANRYLSPDQNKMTDMKENSFGSNPNIFGYPGSTRDDVLPIASTSEESRFVKTGDSIAALKELCTVEGYNLVFHARTSPDGSVGKETYAKVEIGGQILGNGVGITWEEAKLQAADEALETLRSMLGQFAQKRPGSPRSLAPSFDKRFKLDFPRGVQRVPYEHEILPSCDLTKFPRAG
ncbi:hypothetical protein GUJ93_ZPchr0024g29058 [Zizania palustris]|uniref:DRBM domain-containing protein n=1 Tax=Zizania palustris TaxID=103762 RepID=A0A8J5QSX1_ZIZPA|nr:hypothetical protein GUJ93_ZPchr0024g29058 [Zizania palustris]